MLLIFKKEKQMVRMGMKFTNKVLSNYNYTSEKHKKTMITLALNECLKQYDIASMLEVCKIGLEPLTPQKAPVEPLKEIEDIISEPATSEDNSVVDIDIYDTKEDIKEEPSKPIVIKRNNRK